MKNYILDDESIFSNHSFHDDLTRVERLKSMLLDHFIMTMIVGILFIIPVVIVESFGPNIYTEFIFYLLMGLYVNKDFLNSMSLGKRRTNQIIVDSSTNKPANHLRCAIRNFTVMFWPIEVAIILIKPNRRIGDLIAGTKVVRIENYLRQDIVAEFKIINKKSLLFPYIVSVGSVWILFKLIDEFVLFTGLFSQGCFG